MLKSNWEIKLIMAVWLSGCIQINSFHLISEWNCWRQQLNSAIINEIEINLEFSSHKAKARDSGTSMDWFSFWLKSKFQSVNEFNACFLAPNHPQALIPELKLDWPEWNQLRQEINPAIKLRKFDLRINVIITVDWWKLNANETWRNQKWTANQLNQSRNSLINEI